MPRRRGACRRRVCHLRRDAFQPPGRDRVEAEVRRDRLYARASGRDQRSTSTAGRGEITVDRAEAQPAGVPAADRVLAVVLQVDTALDTRAARAALGTHLVPPGRNPRRYEHGRALDGQTRQRPLLRVDQKLTNGYGAPGRGGNCQQTSPFPGTLSGANGTQCEPLRAASWRPDVA